MYKKLYLKKLKKKLTKFDKWWLERKIDDDEEEET